MLVYSPTRSPKYMDCKKVKEAYLSRRFRASGVALIDQKIMQFLDLVYTRIVDVILF